MSRKRDRARSLFFAKLLSLAKMMTDFEINSLCAGQ
jgi:hypothetical protein